MKGVIKQLKPAQVIDGRKVGGYGFIRDEFDRDRFFNANDLRGDMDFGALVEHHNRNESRRVPTRVEFIPVEGRAKGNGLAAECVLVLL